MDGYLVSELAERAGVAASTVRYYEREGLLPAERSAAGYRLYDDEAVRRLAFIGSAKRLGMGLSEIGALLAVRDGGVCAHVRAELRPLLAARADEARGRITELESLIDRLGSARAALFGPDRPGPCGPECATLHTAGERDARNARWRGIAATARREPCGDGVRLVLADSVDLVALARLIADERHRHPHVTFTLRVESPVILEIAAPEDARPLLDDIARAATGARPDGRLADPGRR